MPVRWLSPVSISRIERGLDHDDPAPLWRQLYKAIRDLIIDGQATSGARLPSSRALAHDLGISRHSVVTAVEQLVGEGYLVGRRGSGTYVGEHFATRPAAPVQQSANSPRLSRRGDAIRSLPRSPLAADDSSPAGLAFRVGLPAVDAFPRQLWRSLLGRAWQQSSMQLGYNDPLGVGELREAIAAYLFASRGLACATEQIVVVAGSQAALDVCARLFLDPGDHVAVEDPGYLGAHGALRASGAQLLPVPVDDHGLDVAALAASDTPIRAVYVTPTHQFPSGVTMSLDRRLALLAWAQRHDAWIIEDDYDSEYRYGARPRDPLAVLDRASRVIYIGTFSKVMFPALRLGYLVLPSALVDSFKAASLCTTIHPPPLEQLALATFMRDGHFARHLQRTKELHAERRAALLADGQLHLSGVLDLQPAEAGLHLMGILADGPADIDVVGAARQRAVDVWALSSHTIASQHNGLLLGYGGTTPAQIATGIRALAAAIDHVIADL